MTTALYTHASSAEHDTGEGHPERIERIEAVNGALSGESWAALRRSDAPRATPDQLKRVHVGGDVDLVPFARRDIMPNRSAAWASVCSTMSPSAQCMRAPFTG